MNNFKKVGLTALAGSLAAISAQAAEMAVSGASVLTWTNKGQHEVTGNPMGMKTNLSFNASGEVNGYTVSYMQTSADQFAGMSSARLSVDMGDMGILAFDQGSGSVGGLVGAAGSSGVFNYIKELGGTTLNAAARNGSGTSSADGGASGAGGEAWDFALTNSSMIDGLSTGFGYGQNKVGQTASAAGSLDHDIHHTIFGNYAVGPATLGYQYSDIQRGANGAAGELATAWGVAINVNDNLSVSYGERDVEYDNPSATNQTEKGKGYAIAYTMGSIKIAGNKNEVTNNGGDTTAGGEDGSTEVALSFAF